MAQKRIVDFFSKSQASDSKRLRENADDPTLSLPHLCHCRSIGSKPPPQHLSPSPSPPEAASPSLAGDDNISSSEALAIQNGESSDSFRPLGTYIFPARRFAREGFTRSCQAAWFREWQWLEYIACTDSIVCGVCRSALKTRLIPTSDSLFMKGLLKLEKGYRENKRT